MTKLKDDLSPEEVIEFLRLCESKEMDSDHFNDIAEKFEKYVQNDPIAFSKLASQIIQLHPCFTNAFFRGIGNAMERKRIDWTVVLTSYEQMINPVKPSRLQRVSINHTIAQTINDGMKERSIDFRLKDRIWKILSRLAIIENNDPYEKQTYPIYDKPSYYIAKWAAEGAAFDSIVSYALWCGDNTGGKKVLVGEVRELISDYLDHKIPATIASQAVLGYHLSDLYRLDKDWIRPRLDQLFIRENESFSKSAWDGYILSDVDKDIFTDLVDKYNSHVQELKGPPRYDDTLWKVDKRVIEHVTRAYLFKFDNGKELFDELTIHSHDIIRSHCGQYISQILKEQEGKHDKFLDNDVFRELWKSGRLTPYAEIYDWFKFSFFDEKEKLELLHDSLEKLDDDADITFPVEELESYARLYPERTAKCLFLLVEMKLKSGKYYRAAELKPLFRILLDVDRTEGEATQMIQKLSKSSFAEYSELLELIERIR